MTKYKNKYELNKSCRSSDKEESIIEKYFIGKGDERLKYHTFTSRADIENIVFLIINYTLDRLTNLGTGITGQLQTSFMGTNCYNLGHGVAEHNTCFLLTSHLPQEKGNMWLSYGHQVSSSKIANQIKSLLLFWGRVRSQSKDRSIIPVALQPYKKIQVEKALCLPQNPTAFVSYNPLRLILSHTRSVAD